jgi:aryl carrier-like protein
VSVSSEDAGVIESAQAIALEADDNLLGHGLKTIEANALVSDIRLRNASMAR